MPGAERAGAQDRLPYAETIEWLLRCPEAGVRAQVLRDLLNRPQDDPLLLAAGQATLQGAWVQGLLSGQQADGGFGVHPYQKWTGAHWRLVSLVELGVPKGEERAIAAAETVLDWLTGADHRSRIHKLSGLTRRCASQEGNALAVCCRLGLAGDRRVQLLAQSLVEWQWPDGGWNCDKSPQAHHSSFHESLIPLWGLVEYHRATDDQSSLQAAHRAAQLFLRHSLFRSERTQQVIHPAWLKLHYPPYWHYDILQALLVLSRLGPLDDPRLEEALDVIEALRRQDGTWAAQGYYWHLPDRPGGNVEAIHWGRKGPNPMLTLNALRVLKSAGRAAF